MRVPAVALGVNQSVATAAVIGSGAFGHAVAGLLSTIGHQVQLIGDNGTVASECDLWTQSRARYTAPVNIKASDDLSAIRTSDCVFVAVPATEYGAVAQDLADSLSSGQTVFIMGAAIGASLEIASILEKSRRGELNVNLVEVVQPFSHCAFDGKTVRIQGLRDRLAIAGRSLNETRSGLSAGGSLLNGLVPASNIIDRAFADINKWLETAALLFNSFDRSVEPVSDGTSFDCSPADNTNLVISALRSELQALGKAYGVKRLEESTMLDARLIRSNEWKNSLARGIIEEYVILSSLARLTYMQAPMIDTVIELACVVTNMDLRKEARQLTHLGIIGMDAREIIEHIN